MEDIQEELYFQNESGKTNLFDNSMMHPTNSTIPRRSQETNNEATKMALGAMNIDIFPYPDQDEIPEINIKDEDYRIYEDNIGRFDDNKYNRCKICSIMDNSFFCENCRKNLCENCSRGRCQNEIRHKLINLAQMKEDSKNYLLDIEQLFSKYFILQKSKQENPNIKKEINYDISIHEDQPFEGEFKKHDTNDIQLIDKIMKKSYNNFFHYKNIKKCRDYLFNRYDGSFDNDCLKIEYKVKNCKGKDIRIFGKTFVNNNKDKLSLIINNKKSKLIETTKVNEDYLEVILVQKSDDEENREN